MPRDYLKYTLFNLKSLKTKNSLITTELPKLDDLLGGGLKKGIITDIYGPSGIGKTQFALQFSIYSILNGDQVLFQDTSGNFRPERIHEILKNRGNEIQLMNNVKVLRLTNTIEQIQSLRKIYTGFSLIVIDNISDLFIYEYSKSEKFFEMNLLFAKYLHSLSLLALERKIPIIITNMVKNFEGQEIESLEKTINLFCHTKIRLIKQGRKLIARVLSPYKSGEFYYQVRSEGISQAN